MAKNLVIVESPAKARTIEKYLGSDYHVKSSFGHIRDLPKKGLSVDKEHSFHPTYEVPADKKKVVAELKKAAAGNTVWLATDEDREGEAIAWHLCEALKLDPKSTKRIVFHEITKPAITEAIKSPRTVDLHLVDAQQARRVLDRLVGYELSPVLWKKVRPGLSAGRVQSVAVRIIVEREREITDFKAEASFKVTATFDTTKDDLPAELNIKLSEIEKAQNFLDSNKDATFTIKAIETKPGTRNPGPPFTTSTLQQEASRRLGYGVKQTMTLAQRLYENGHITYMRTDSTNISPIAISAATDYIGKTFGKEYSQTRQFKTKDASAQEAHEAIRPTNIAHTEAGDDPQQQKLYNLIWQRFLASQMSPAKIDKTEVQINISSDKSYFVANGEVLIFDGFLKVYGGGKDDVILPPLNQGQTLKLIEMKAAETFSRAPARYSEATLVKALEEMGIGRPSTYAPTISTIQDRGYIEKRDLDGKPRTIRSLSVKPGKTVEATTEEVITGADKNKLLPTAMADVTTDFLTKYFAPIVDFDFTAKVELEFDEIEEGKHTWNEMIADFYTNEFHPLIEKSADVSRSDAAQARELGTDPKSGKPITARYGRFGPMLQLGEATDEDKPTFAPLPVETTLDTVTLEQALEMFKLPRTVGETKEGEEIKANIGRFGPYVQVGKTFVSIKDHDPLTIDEATARELIQAKKEASKPILEFSGGIKVINGPYGPYITNGKKNARIPKDTEPASLTLAQCKDLLEKAPAKGKGKRRFTRKKK